MTAQSSQIKAEMFEIWLMRKIMMLNQTQAKPSRIILRAGNWQMPSNIYRRNAIETTHDSEHPPWFQNKKKHAVLLDSNWWLMTLVS